GTAVEEERRHRDRLAEEPAGVAAQVEDESARASPRQPLHLLPHELGGACTEVRETDDAPARARVQDDSSLHGLRAHEAAVELHLERRSLPAEDERDAAARRTDDAIERHGSVEADHRAAADLDDHVAAVHACACSRAMLDADDDE